MNKQPEIQDVGPEIQEAQAKAKVCRDNYEGIEEMREAGETYLPKNPRETDPDYKLRLGLTDYFPALQHAVHAYIGKPLGSPIVVDGAPGEVEATLDNVDLAGNDLDMWARQSLTCGIVDGVTFAVADYPVVPAGSTLAQERALGARPYLVHVPLENVVDIHYAMVGGAQKVVHFRYKECASVQDGRWGSRKVERIRVLEPGMVEVWEAQQGLDGKTTWVLLADLSGPVSVPEVPVAKFSAMNEDEPPLTELAWLNVRHWQSKSEQNHILHVARVPLLAADEDTRVDQEAAVEIGVKGLITGFKGLKYVEIEGKAIEAGRTDIMDTEDRMRRVAGQMLVTESGQKSATEAALEGGEGASQLRAWVGNFQSFLNECLRLLALWVGQKEGGKAQVDMEWDEVQVGADLLTALSTMREKGQITAEVLFFNLQKASIIPPDMTFDEFQARLDMEAPAPMPVVSPRKPPKVATITNPDGSTSTVQMS